MRPVELYPAGILLDDSTTYAGASMKKPTLALSAVLLALAAAPAYAGDGTDLLKLAPESTQMVLVLDMADARDSPLVQKGFTKLLDASASAKSKLAELGLDPMKDIDTVMFAGGGATDLAPDQVKNVMIVVEGRLPKDKLATAPNAIKTAYQGVTIYTSNDTDAAFIGDRLIFTKKGSMKAAIDLALDRGKSKGKSAAVSKKAKALRDAIAATNTRADFWATVLIPAKTQKTMQKDLAAKTIAVGFDFTADLSAQLKLGTANPAAAAKGVAGIQAMLPQAVQGFQQLGMTKAAKSLVVAQDGAAVAISITLTEAELMSLFKTLQSFGMMGGASSPAAPPPPPPAPPAAKP